MRCRDYLRSVGEPSIITQVLTAEEGDRRQKTENQREDCMRRAWPEGLTLKMEDMAMS